MRKINSKCFSGYIKISLRQGYPNKPLAWESKFIAFSTEASILSIGYTMIKVKHTQGLRRLLFDRLLAVLKPNSN